MSVGKDLQCDGSAVKDVGEMAEGGSLGKPFEVQEVDDQQTASHPSRPPRLPSWRRKALGLLNKLSDQNEVKVLKQLAADCVPENFQELVELSELLYRRAIADPERMKLYIRLLCGLDHALPRFADDSRQPQRRPGAASWTTSRSWGLMGRILQSCQATLDRHRRCLEDGDADSILELKTLTVNTCRFLAELYLAELISPRILAQVLIELLRSSPRSPEKRDPRGPCIEADTIPNETSVECACDLLRVFLKAGLHVTMGKEALRVIWRRLSWLREASAVHGQFVYSPRLRFKILDILEAV